MKQASLFLIYLCPLAAFCQTEAWVRHVIDKASMAPTGSAWPAWCRQSTPRPTKPSRISPNQPKADSLTLEQAAEKLGICPTTTGKLVDLGVIKGTQVIPYAPWQIFPAALETGPVQRAVNQIRRGKPLPEQHFDDYPKTCFQEEIEDGPRNPKDADWDYDLGWSW